MNLKRMIWKLGVLATVLAAEGSAASPAAGGSSVRAFCRRAEAGERLTVAFFGGSLTRGANATDPNHMSWRARFAGLYRTAADVRGEMPEREELDVIAGATGDAQCVRVAVGRFRDRLVFTNHLETVVQVKFLPELAGRTVSVETLVLDDRTNWYCDWQRDRENYGVKKDDYAWSPDDFAILGSRTLIPDNLRILFAEHLQPVYASRAATVRPFVRRETIGSDGTLTIPVDFVGNGANFVLIKVTSEGE